MAEQRQFSKAELSSLDGRHNLHLMIHGKVYDVHEFINEHPGGDLVLLGEAGEDATKAFEDVQHSDDAKELMKVYLVGSCPAASSEPKIKGIGQTAVTGRRKDSITSGVLLLLLASVGLVLLLGLCWQKR